MSFVQPRIHPYTFSVIYASVSILALTENGVLNSTVVALTIAQAQAISMLYMQIIWFWVGYKEKVRNDDYHHFEATHAADMYRTKELQFSLYAGIIAMAIIAILQFVSPYDYNTSDISLRAAPLLFLVISVWGTLIVQSMQLGDEYGKEKPAEPLDKSEKELLIWRATRITPGKLAVSVILLLFATLYELNIVGDYFRDLRAYSDKLPDRAWQYDLASKYTIGTGFLSSGVTYL
jgi:hypothetical protein